MGWVCWSVGIMVIDCVQRDRSEREFRSGDGDMLAKRVRTAEALRVVVRSIKTGLVSRLEGVVGVRASLDCEDGLKIP